MNWAPTDSGTFYTTTDKHGLLVWDTNTLTQKFRKSFNNRITIAKGSFAGGGYVVIAGGAFTNYLRLVDLRTGLAVQVFKGHTEEVTTLDWNPQNEYEFVSCSTDGANIVWDIRKPKPLAQLGKGVFKEYFADCSSQDERTVGVKYSPHGTHIYTCTWAGTIRKWDGFGFVQVGARTLLTRGNPVRQFALSPDERFLFQPEGNAVNCVDTGSGKTIRRFCGHLDFVNGCVFRNDAFELCSTGHDLHTILWQNRGSGCYVSTDGDGDEMGDEIDYWSD